MNQDFKDRLKKVMEIRGVKQYELALQTEMNKSVINRYCSGTYYPKYPNLIKICKVLKCSPAYLLGESEDYDDFDGLKLANFLHSTTPEINDLESMSVDFAMSDEEEITRRQELLRLRKEQNLPDGEFYHYDTPLTVAHEKEALLDAGFSSVEVLKNWDHTYTLKATK